MSLDKVIAVLLGVAGWWVSHLFAQWRQLASHQSEHRWKLVATYAEFIDTCSRCADRIYALHTVRSRWAGYYRQQSPEMKQAIGDAENEYYLARAAVDASWTLLELLEPSRPHGEELLRALDNSAQANDSVQLKTDLQNVFRLREGLVRSVHQELVLGWRPVAGSDIVKDWVLVRRQRLSRWWSGSVLRRKDSGAA